MRVLVTGGAGYVGGFTARHLLAADHHVVCLDDLSLGHRAALPEGVLCEGRIEDTALVSRLLREHEIEAVVHFAAWSALGESVRAPARYYRNNVANMLSLMESMHACGVRRIVMSSSASVYGEHAEMPLREDAPLAPASPYAFSKLVMERMIADFASAYGWSYALLRYFNAAGAASDGAHGEDHEPETHLIPLAIQSVLGQREPLAIFGDDYPTRDGTCERDYVHVHDLADAHERALVYTGERTGDGAAFNLGSGRGTTVLEILESIARVAGRPVPGRRAARRPGDVPSLVAAPERVESVLGWKPSHTEIDSIVRSAWAWHTAHPEGYGDR